MKKFLSVALKFQWKTIVFIFALIIIQTFVQMEIIDLFGAALTGVKEQNVDLLFKSGLYMLMYTVISMIAVYVISFLTTRVASKSAYTVREKIFHILMNLPREEIDKFKISGLVTRSTRGMSSEQGFIVMILEQLMLIPVTFVAIVYEIALIDGTYALFFLGFIGVLSAIIIFRMKQIVEIFFRAKKTYGKLNLLFLSKINDIAGRIPFNKQEYEVEFEKACENSYDKNVIYIKSQCYLGPILMWGLYVIVLVTLAMVNSGYTIGFETDSVIDSFIILVYVAYFITTLANIPALIDRWPRAYATSVRLEEVLNIEDKIIKSNTNDNLKEIEIVEEDIAQEAKGIWDERKGISEKFTALLKEDKAKVRISMILLTISTLCMVYAPKVAGKTVDLLASNWNSTNDPAIYISLALLLVLYSVGYLFKLPPKRIMGATGEKVAYDLRVKLFDKLDAVGSDFIQENSKGLVLSRLNNDVMNIREFVSSKFTEIYAQILFIVFVIVLIVMTDFRLSLIYLVILPVYAVCFYVCDVKSKNYYDGHQMQLGRLMSYFERGLSNRDSFHEKGFKKMNQTVIDYYVKSKNVTNFMVPVTTLLTNISKITVYIAGIYFLAGNEIQIGTLLAVIMYGQLLTDPIKKLSSSMATIETSFSSIKRIFAIIDYKNDK
ncbi:MULTISPECIES: ABC transporter transmembrane domain-containing protein [Methanobrevibacter]|jgi:ABC-type multidrug transport system fused ATPase/permease subunit|uniref:Putative multidrug export ATP-binding/permease protein n=3 Tax=Methanobrevibacter TaxID=2172 RepID=A0A315XJS8_9EURY|nr:MULTISPECIES: ABC transporter transmembrane domain-containing protein [Methanobrevibacter]MBE6490764.1 ABC transporter ATP-binding protein [Methanobrevibacter sp.]MBE6498830.1 ABC transporter ATP-binding protein [Methanobrevibacter sp.]MBR2556766.1 ABC transporter ATP-binding protein [Methanobrevibacter sp.]MEE0901910.1 ABC transporter transmembrane domain-containing protein [Methanobrevibacter sp.]MEE0936155.1 ABC transporter transmembrane domain-containing protein [Methanobrevibacter sp.]